MGLCDPQRAQRSRLNRLLDGRHPETGTRFDKVTQGTPSAPGGRGLAGDGVTDDDLTARAAAEQPEEGGRPSGMGAADALGFDVEEAEFMEEWGNAGDGGHPEPAEPP